MVTMRRSQSHINSKAPAGGMTSSSILQDYEKMYAEAKAANEQRYQQALGILDEAITRYSPGGGFGQGAMALYEQGKGQALAGGMQNLVQSGLSNTTVAAGLPLAYEQEVGTPFRLQLEDMRMQNLTEAERAKVGMIESRSDPYPDYGMFAQLAMQAASGGGGGVQYVGSPFPSDQPGYSGIMNDYGRTPSSSYSPQTSSYYEGSKASQRGTAISPSRTPTSTSMSDDEYQALLNQNLTANNLFQQYDYKTRQPIKYGGSKSFY